MYEYLVCMYVYFKIIISSRWESKERWAKCAAEALLCAFSSSLYSMNTFCNLQRQTNKQGEMRIDQSFYLIEVTYMEYSIQFPVGNKPKYLMQGAKSCVIKVSSGKRMPKENKHPGRMQMQVFQPWWNTWKCKGCTFTLPWILSLDWVHLYICLYASVTCTPIWISPNRET